MQVQVAAVWRRHMTGILLREHDTNTHLLCALRTFREAKSRYPSDREMIEQITALLEQASDLDKKLTAQKNERLPEEHRRAEARAAAKREKARALRQPARHADKEKANV